MSSWWKSAVRKLETMRELPCCSERPMPGMGYCSSLCGHEADAAHTAADTTAGILGSEIAPRSRAGAACQAIGAPR